MASPAPKLLPWGRLVLLTEAQKESLPNHYDLSRSKHCVGRVANRSDIHIPKQFISAIHCIVRLLGKDDDGEAIVEVEDLSRHGVWVNHRKVGYHSKVFLKNGYVIHLTPPDSKDVMELAYKFEILLSGLTKQNEELHARLSADEMSVAGRTRKRLHGELQCTQSPTKVVLSPPSSPRPAKKRRRVYISQQLSQDEPVKEPDSEHDITPAVQSAALATEDTQSSLKRVAGKIRKRSEESALESKLAKLQKQNDELKDVITDSVVTRIKQLESAQEELEAVRKDNEVLKRKCEEEIAALKKCHEEEIKRLKDQAAADLDRCEEQAKMTENALKQECNALKRSLNHLVTDPKMPHQIRTISELEAKVQVLTHQYKTEQENQALLIQQHDRPTPPSKKQLIEHERKLHLGRQLCVSQEETGRMIREMYLQVNERMQEEKKLCESITMPPSSLSGSSQSQDSIDQRHIDRRSSQLSEASNEHSITSPSDPPLTVDAPETETKSGNTALGRPPLFNIFGAQSTTADTGSSSTIRPATLSQPDFYRAQGAKRAEDEEKTTRWT